ncbi:hypothetical protein [Mycobacterium colombiense]|uniref:hypothetical protein n=1 Tax=Mycobacterium colombiense TaxID=339268 RepID=UPI001153DD44|nr:hypothetical protein [Mycobacterium colombiense]
MAFDQGVSAGGATDSGDSLNTSKRCRVRVDGEGLAFDVKVDDAVAGAVVQLVMGGGLPPAMRSPGGVSSTEPQQPGSPADERPAGRPELTLGEYLAATEAKTNVDKIAAVGEYLAEHNSQSSFTSDDVRTQLLAIREDVPGNLPRDVAAAAKARYIAEDTTTKGAYYVTGTGRAAIANKFPRLPRKRARSKKATSA